MKKFFSVVLVVVAVLLNSQIIKGVVVSAEDHSAVPFAKIGFDDAEKGSISDADGKFTIDLKNADNAAILQVVVPGFQNYSIPVAKFVQLNNHTISLTPRIKEIEEVRISPKKMIDRKLGYQSTSKKIHFDYLSKNSPLVQKRYTPEELEKPQAEIAVPIESRKKAKITKLNINFAKFTVEKGFPARFIIYSETDGKPGNIINQEDLIFTIEQKNIKDNVFTLDVTDKNIWFTGKIFVSFQPLDRNFEGTFWMSAGFLGTSYVRSFIEKWRKTPATLAPAIYADVKMEK